MRILLTSSAALILSFFVQSLSAMDNPLVLNPDPENIEEITNLAAGYEQPLVRAPAIVNVITALDIQKMGATTVAEVLETVPGLHVSNARGLNDLFLIRGFFDEFNSYILLMVNGIPVNNVVNGGRPQAWKMPVHNITRIEIIRGPGSALYGADAMAGVINIVTKTAKELNGFQGGLYGGSFDTYGGWVQWGGLIGDIESAFSLETSTTEGYKTILRADAQTAIDKLLKTEASLAPGPLNTQRDDVDVRLDLKGQDWRFRAGYQGFLNVGTGTGIVLILDPQGNFDTRLSNADFTYDLPINGWKVTTQASYLGTTTDARLYPYPPGAFKGLFPNGLKNDLHFQVDELRSGITAVYGELPKHRIRLGAGLSYTDLSDIRESRNFLLRTDGPPFPAPFSNVTALGQDPLLMEHSRILWYGFVQDEWWLSADWILTGGIRIDHYSDFGTAIDPRLALVWNLSPTLNAKMLYGRAFRAPNFTELYGNSAISIIGNRNLAPETMNMLDFSLSKQWAPQTKLTATLFGYDINNQIRGSFGSNDTAPTAKQNLPGRKGYGIELEGTYQATNYLALKGSYSNSFLADAISSDLGRFMPKHQGTLRVDWQITDNWLFSTHWHWVSDRKMAYANRPFKLDGYTWATATLRYDDPKGWFLTLRANNLLDAEAFEPTNLVSIPSGIPLPGRNITAQLGIHLP